MCLGAWAVPLVATTECAGRSAEPCRRTKKNCSKNYFLMVLQINFLMVLQNSFLMVLRALGFLFVFLFGGSKHLFREQFFNGSTEQFFNGSTEQFLIVLQNSFLMVQQTSFKWF